MHSRLLKIMKEFKNYLQTQKIKRRYLYKSIKKLGDVFNEVGS